MLQDLTGVPTVAVLPMWWQHGLPEEDGVIHDRPEVQGVVAQDHRRRCLPAHQQPRRIPAAEERARRASEMGAWPGRPGGRRLGHPARLQGTPAADLAWLRAQGLDRAIAAHAAQGGAVLGICGGLQMLGEALIDPHGIDGNAPGLGLLPLVTVFEPAKTVQRTQARFGQLTGVGRALGRAVAGYEIHHGQTAQHPAMAAAGDLARVALTGPQGEPLGWQNATGNVLGLYLHGLFEDPSVLQALFGASVPTLDSVFDGLADFVERHFAPGALEALVAESGSTGA
jgi:adenosylcobyric acid synthase